MSMVNCPECGHKVSAVNASCPNCGRALSETPPAVSHNSLLPAPPVDDTGIPSWALLPIGALVLVLLFLGFLVVRQSDDDEYADVDVSLPVWRAPAEPAAAPVPASETLPVLQSASGPQTSSRPAATRSAVSSGPKGTAVIKARVAHPHGTPESVRNTRFYLLDKDIETILGEARLEPIDGNTLSDSLGLAVVFPDRYSDFQQSAMRAIASHSKYSVATDGGGTANLGGITPKEYYLFGIAPVDNGFALWNSPISVTAGENEINLSPQSVTEVPDTGDEP